MNDSMNDAARRALEAMMKGYEYQSDFAKKYVAQGHAEGLTKGLTEGLTKGLTEGLSKGRTEATALNVLTVLRVRGIEVPDVVRERILAQKDPERLERWLEKAIVATSVAAVLDEPH
jgi:flagellar biosynthesis/type III secretory pathway protein FliH